MGFFNSLTEVVTNRQQFRDWEKQNNDKQAKREVLAKQKNLSEAELTRAAKKGKIMMDVVDIMDTHSENVSENVETTTQPFAQLIPFGATAATFIGTFKYVGEPANRALGKAKRNFYNTQDGKRWGDITDRLKQLSGNGTYYSEAEKKVIVEDLRNLGGIGGFFSSDRHDSDIFKSSNIKILAKSTSEEAQGYAEELQKLGKKYKQAILKEETAFNRAQKIMAGGTLGVGLVTYILSNIAAAKLQVGSSRVARWQSRQDLQDPRYFVEYTDEQIEDAKKRLKEKPKEEKKGLFGFFKKGNKEDKTPFDRKDGLLTIKDTIKDSRKYNKWKKTYNQDDRKVKRELTKDELIQAEKDQEAIQRVTKEINNKAEEYSQNMEVAANVILGSTPFLGAAIGAIVNKIVDKTGIGDKFSESMFKRIEDLADDKEIVSRGKWQNGNYQIVNTGKTERQLLREAWEGIYPDIKDPVTGQIKKGSISYSNLYDYAMDSLKILDRNSASKGSSSKFAKIADALSNLFQAGVSTGPARRMLTSIAAIGATSVTGALIALKLEKNAGRAGRFMAKRDIEENPANFIGYTEDEYNSVQDVTKEEKTTAEKFKNYMTFIPRMVKESFAYDKYKKTVAKDDENLLRELVKSNNITEKQLNDAKDMQRKLFVTFENVDDKSQEYSESIEAATDMIQPFIPLAGMGIAAAPFVIGGINMVKKGGAGAAESITDFLAKHTGFLQGKTVKNYIDEVAQNITRAVEKQTITAPTGGDLSAPREISKFISNSPVREIHIARISDAISEALKAAKGKDNELKVFLDTIANNQTLKNIKKEDLFEFFERSLSPRGSIVNRAESYLDRIEGGEILKGVKKEDVISNLEYLEFSGKRKAEDMCKDIVNLFNRTGEEELSGVPKEDLISMLTANSISKDKSALEKTYRQVLDSFSDGETLEKVKRSDLISKLAETFEPTEDRLIYRTYRNVINGFGESDVIDGVKKSDITERFNTELINNGLGKSEIFEFIKPIFADAHNASDIFKKMFKTLEFSPVNIQVSKLSDVTTGGVIQRLLSVENMEKMLVGENGATLIQIVKKLGDCKKPEDLRRIFDEKETSEFIEQGVDKLNKMAQDKGETLKTAVSQLADFAQNSGIINDTHAGIVNGITGAVTDSFKNGLISKNILKQAATNETVFNAISPYLEGLSKISSGLIKPIEKQMGDISESVKRFGFADESFIEAMSKTNGDITGVLFGTLKAPFIKSRKAEKLTQEVTEQAQDALSAKLPWQEELKKAIKAKFGHVENEQERQELLKDIPEIFQTIADLPGGKQIMQKLAYTDVTTEQMINIISNMETITRNIPKEDLIKIMDATINAALKDPEKFAQWVKSGSMANVLMTEGLAKGIAIASTAWAALSFVLTFTLESIFASIQKDAGRLGVMKALEDLQDKTYYANEINSAPFQNNPEHNKTNTSISFKDFLSKFQH